MGHVLSQNLEVGGCWTGQGDTEAEYLVLCGLSKGMTPEVTPRPFSQQPGTVTSQSKQLLDDS